MIDSELVTSQNAPHWYRLKENDPNLAPTLFAEVVQTRKRQSYRHEAYRNYYEQYSGVGAGPLLSNGESNDYQAWLTDNESRAIIDTAHAKIYKTKPRPRFETNGGDFPEQQLAEQLQDLADGLIYETKMYELDEQCALDMLIFGQCYLKVGADEERRVKLFRIFPDNIVVDDIDGLNGTTKNMYHLDYQNKDYLMKVFNKSKGFLDGAEGLDMKALASTQNRDVVKTIEAWHLPTSLNSKDGRHVIIVSNKVLLDEPWEFQDFPIATCRWSTPPQYYHGIGLCHDLRPMQTYLDGLVRDTQAMLHLCAVPKYMVPNGCNMSYSLTNGIGGTIKYTPGLKPELEVWEPIPQQILAEREATKATMWALSHLNQNTAAGQNPLGPDASGAAQRELDDIVSDAFALKLANWERFIISTVEKMLECVQDLAMENAPLDKKGEPKGRGSYPVMVPRDGYQDEIDWKDVDISRDQYRITCQAASSLPLTTAARMETVKDWSQAGFIDPMEARELLGFPDLKEANSIDLAARLIVKKQVASILSKGKYWAPSQYCDLQFAIKYSSLSYDRAQMNKAPPDRLKKLNDYIVAIKDLIQAATPPPPPVAPAAPGAIPTPPPVSPLLPNAPK